jgi:hypothetical protein
MLLGGGIEEGSSTLVSGPPGTGKSSVAMQFVKAMTDRGERAAMFLFEESFNTLLNRSEGIGIDLRTPYEAGLLTVHQIDPAEMSPGEFSHAVCGAADQGARVVVIDSLNGYMNAMPEAGFLCTHLHEILTYLGQRGVLSFLVGVQQGIVGSHVDRHGCQLYGGQRPDPALLRGQGRRPEGDFRVQEARQRPRDHLRQFNITPRGLTSARCSAISRAS